MPPAAASEGAAHAEDAAEHFWKGEAEPAVRDVVADGVGDPSAGLADAALVANLSEIRRQSITIFDYLERFQIGYETSNRVDNILIFGEGDDLLGPSFAESVAAEPLPLDADDLCEVSLDVNRLAPALATALAFVSAAEAVPAARDLHQLGIAQPTKGRALPVFIYVPRGLPTDRAHFLRLQSDLPASVLYVPTSRWQTPDAFKLAANRGIAIESLGDRLAETLPVPATLSAPDEPASSAKRTRLRAHLRVQTGWRWEDVRIRLTIRATMITSHGTERGEHSFASVEKGETIRRFPRLFQMLIEISFAGHWQNPAPHTRDYEKGSKSFQRLRQTIEKLIPIPSEAFTRDGNRWRPRFQIHLDEEMEAVARRHYSTTNPNAMTTRKTPTDRPAPISKTK
ncbi:MAG: hypothetical protein ABMA13_05145 [Chthoniobacteraceae bacterium]